MPALCLNRIKPSIMVLRSQPLKLQRMKSSRDLGLSKEEKKETAKEKCQSSTCGVGGFGDADGGGNGAGKEEDAGPSDVKFSGRKIMVVVDHSDEARGALQWALTHALQSHDILVLLHASTLSKQGDEGNTTSKMMRPRVYKLLHSLKKTCHKKRPEAQVEVCAVQGKDKGSVIVEEARKQQVSLLVLGQKKKHSTAWQILLMWAGSKIPVVGGGGGGHKSGVVEYCIRNADCMAIAVRRKSKRAGGYLITTKRHKDFWLLA